MSQNKMPIYALTFLANMGYGLILPGLSLYAASLGSNYSFIGIMISIFAAAQLITQIPAGKISDKMGRKLLITIGFTGVTIAALLYNFTNRPTHFLLLQVLAGLSIGCVWPPLLAQLTDQTLPHERGRVMGIFNTVFFVGIGLGPLVGGYVSSTLGFLSVFNIWALISFIGALTGLVTFKDPPGKVETPETKKETSPSDDGLFKKGTLLSFIGTCAVRSRGGFCTSFNNAILPLYATALFAIPQSMIGGLMFIHGIMLAAFTIPGGVISDRFGRKWPPIYGSLIATVGVFWYSFPDGYWSLFIAVALAGGGAGFATPALQALVGDISIPSRRGEAFGYFLTSFYIGTVFGASGFGFLADLIGLRSTALSWGVFSLALALCGMIIRSEVARPVPAPVRQTSPIILSPPEPM